MTPTLAKHLAAVRSGTIERTNVIGIRKQINAMEKGWNWGGSWRAKMPDTDDVWTVEMAIAERKPFVGPELHASGVKVLRNPRYAKRWTEREGAIIHNLAAFRLVAFQRITRANICVPVYEAIAHGGTSCLFRNIPWQTAWSYKELQDGPTIVQAEEL